MPFMGTDLGKLMKHETLSEDRIQFLVYQMLKGLKVGFAEVAIGKWVGRASCLGRVGLCGLGYLTLMAAELSLSHSIYMLLVSSTE